MKKVIVLSIIACLGILGALPASARDDKDRSAHGDKSKTGVEQPDDCYYCGMNRTAFAHSRTLIEYEDGTVFGGCSINCAVIDLEKNPAKKVKRLAVADYSSKKLIDARTAVWVIGGSRKGVMTRNPKWAFAGKKEADAFVKEFGGIVATYDQAVKAVSEELRQRSKPKDHAHK